MAKPTTPFGFIAFGKDGSVTRHIETLSDKKHEQEQRVGEAFIELAGHVLSQAAKIEPLRENDNDFAIFIDGKKVIEVECIEIVFPDFLASEGAASSEAIAFEGGQVKPIDIERRDDILVKKIQHKLNKHYAKSVGTELWLLIWSVTGYLGFYEHISGGKAVIPECISRARQFVRETGRGAFDRIFVFNLLTRPTEI